MACKLKRRFLLLGSLSLPILTLAGGYGAMAATVAELQQLVRQRENALRITQSRYAEGKVPYTNVQARERELAEARAMLAKAQGGGSVSTQQSTPSKSETQTSANTAASTSGPTTTVYNSAQLQQALNSAGSGRRIVLKAGTYSGTFVVRANGQTNAPIVITGDPSNVTLLSTLTIHGNHVHVQGINFRNAALVVRGDNCRVVGNRFLQSGGQVRLQGAANAEIAFNEFEGWSGNYALEINPFNSGKGRNPNIHHNFFTNSSSIPITIGLQPSHSRLSVGALIEHNLFINCRHSQIINIKSSSNIIRRNTLIGGGAFLNRHGRENSFVENWLEDCGGLWLSDQNCRADGNRLVRCDLLVLAGNIPPAEVVRQVGGHPRAENALLANNDARMIRIGVSWSSSYGKWNLPALNTRVESHRGAMRRELERNSQIKSTNSGNSGNKAIRLQRGQVGLKRV